MMYGSLGAPMTSSITSAYLKTYYSLTLQMNNMQIASEHGQIYLDIGPYQEDGAIGFP